MRLGEPRSPARNPVVPKIPAPIMLEITSAVALTIPSWRSRPGLAVAVVTFAYILSSAALFVLLSAPARARIVAARLLRRRGFGRKGRFRLLIAFNTEHRLEAVEPKAFVEREFDELGFRR